MSQKRQPEDGNSSPEEKRQRVPSLKSVIVEAWKMHAFQKFLSGLEPLIRRVVKEEIEVALRKHLTNMKQNCDKQVHPSSSRSLQLQFQNKLSLPIFTGSKIEGEENSMVEVTLVDTLTGQVVSSSPESSAKVEIVVLEGDFEGTEADSWTVEDFNYNIVKEREGKRPLLTGDTVFNLIEGIAMVGELVFTDNSSWTRSRKFRLGARVLDNNCDRIRIREAKTEAFLVKDHRGELYKKHYPPSLTDEVWRLEKIGKDGAFHKRLSRENINTVKDFLTLLSLDTPRLRKVLLCSHYIISSVTYEFLYLEMKVLGTGMSGKMWDVTLDHAWTCTLDNQMYVYYNPSGQQNMGVVFNVVGQILGLVSEGQYVPDDDISDTEKDVAHNLVKVAYENWESVTSWNDEGHIDASLHMPTVYFPSSSTAAENSSNIRYRSEEFSFNHSTPDMVSSIFSMGGMKNLDNYTLDGVEDMDLRYFTNQVTNSLTRHKEFQSFYEGDDHLQYFNSEASLEYPSLGLESQTDLGTAVSGFLAMSSKNDKAQTKWRILVSVLRWRFSIRRIVALKKSGAREITRGQ
ncbi:hypothetical protein GIB67_000575 [Kingdonia uniflora]|uniref:Calmodulin-binding protein n=1 Tax=Kingdonia uniflora TaxID=39325 RepID=A0A7J7MIL7_9MAGN|nr:hypothetical protein GIB67_000575 [Kingdonia uniflora]